MSFFSAHTVETLAAFYAFSAIVSGMPEPDASSGMGYRWAYQSLHILAGDLSSLIGSRVKIP